MGLGQLSVTGAREHALVRPDLLGEPHGGEAELPARARDELAVRRRRLGPAPPRGAAHAQEGQHEPRFGLGERLGRATRERLAIGHPRPAVLLAGAADGIARAGAHNARAKVGRLNLDRVGHGRS